MSKTFKRTIENFVCQNCGFLVEGNGYTNHCTSCLYSKHVDVYPGDRLDKCEGLMKPVSYETEGRVFFVVHECVRCGHKKRNRVGEKDSKDELIKIAQKQAFW